MNDPSAWVYEEDNKHDPKRHEQERAENGFSTQDWWNFNSYLCWVNIQGLEKFKTGMGFPADLNNMGEWQAELSIMIAGFEVMMKIMDDYDPDTYEEDMKVWERGMKLYTRRFPSLWD